MSQDQVGSNANDSGTGSEIGTPVTQRRSPHVPRSKVYFIRSGEAIKIGVSFNPEQRFGALQVGSALELELLAVMDGDQATEKELHYRFNRLHIRGEWFHADVELLDFIISLTPPETPSQPARAQVRYRPSPPLSAEARATIVSLIHLRSAHKANSPIGHCCSNIVEQITNMAAYERPEWATDVRQTLPWAIEQQMKRLAALRAELN